MKKETTYTSTKTKVTVKKNTKMKKKTEMSKTKTFVTFHSNGTFEISNGLLILIGTRWHDNNTHKNSKRTFQTKGTKKRENVFV